MKKKDNYISMSEVNIILGDDTTESSGSLDEKKKLNLIAGTPKLFRDTTAQIFAIQFEGAGLLELGTTQSCDDLGELQGEAGINTINLGISGISELWLKTSVDKEVTIITYNKI